MMMSGSVGAPFRSMDEPPEANAFERNIKSGRHSPSSPLKLFGQAKTKINAVFIEINNYVDDTNLFLNEVVSSNGIVEENEADKIMLYLKKVEGIRDILSRDRMKVVFFGRTSNGKSTVINAMLKDKVLPSGIGHTTHCFLQVEGVDSDQSYLMKGDTEEVIDQPINKLASALSGDKLSVDSLIRLCWPKERCRLLRDDVVLVDSPGIDVTPDLDSWIDNHCLDADVFVLVANAESTLMQTEKNFFHKVSTKLSKPNIFVLNNRWDASASEPEAMEEVKKQHLERCIQFLAEELKVVTSAEALNRVFFVSAKEALVARLHDAKGTPTEGLLLEGHQIRLFEFASFERKFEECISKSAVQTKFAQHTENGKSIIQELHTLMDVVCRRAQQKKELSERNCELAQKRSLFIEEEIRVLTQEVQQKILLMSEEVERKVATAFSEEIKRLSALVQGFDRPFVPEALQLNVYKKELHVFVEKVMGQNLQQRCSAALQQAVMVTQNQMSDMMGKLVTNEDENDVNEGYSPSREFEVAYHLDCKNLCSGFVEDIEFRFSLGLTSLMHRFLGTSRTQSLLTGHQHVPRPLPVNASMSLQAGQSDEKELLAAVVGMTASLYSRTTVGALAVTGLVAKALGFRAIFFCGVIYGSVYAYERLTWTSKKQERIFKRQYVEYAANKLRLIVDLTSTNCSHQVQQELSSTFRQLKHQIEKLCMSLKEDVTRLQKETSTLSQHANKSSFLKNKSSYLDSELNKFIHEYLKPESNL